MPRPQAASTHLRPHRFPSAAVRLLLPARAHPRNIPSLAPAHK